MSFMDEREKNILEAAVVVFVRYGVKRTTMNDIAGEAGIARQTLYNVYANKDEVLRAVIRLMMGQALAAVETECASATTLGEKIDSAFRHMVIEPYERLHASPHAEDIITGFNDAARDELETAGVRYRALLESVLAPHAKPLRAAGLTPRQLADVVGTASKGFKYEASDKKTLVQLLTSLKALVLAVADGPGGK